MPRASRHFLPGHLWHITHRCHEGEFLLKFARDRRSYVRWLFEARKRFGLCVLDFMVTSNHVHLLVKDTGEGVITQSMQLVASRVAQDYNRRKSRQGPFWEDRYHATAVEAEESLQRCIVYIDLNMVRAGVVAHPRDWDAAGYREIQAPRERYAVIDVSALSTLCGFDDAAQFQRAHRLWIEEALGNSTGTREANWSDAIAVGSKNFVEKVELELGLKAKYREVTAAGDMYALREPAMTYAGIVEGKSDPVVVRCCLIGRSPDSPRRRAT